MTKTRTAKSIIEKFCGEPIDIINVFDDIKGLLIICTRQSLPDRKFCYIVSPRKRKVVFVNSRRNNEVLAQK